MNVLALDTETTTWNNGNPFDLRNKLVCYSWADDISCGARQGVEGCSEVILLADILVGFNFKFDAHWLLKNGVYQLRDKQIWDVQIAEFILSNQTNRFPSLNETCAKYGLGQKVDVVKEDFWERKCSCHVSIVEKLENIMRKDCASLVTPETMNIGIVLNEIKKSKNGAKTILTALKLLNNVDVRLYVQILMWRLGQDELRRNGNITSPILSMINSWLKQTVEYVDQIKIWSSITTTQREELGKCCVDHVILLLAILSDHFGSKEHTHTCESTPVNTDEIPWDVLRHYAAEDARLTLMAYHAQRKLMTPKQIQLCYLMGQDLLILQEMEANGILFDESLCEQRAAEIDEKIKQLTTKLQGFYPSVPINFNSPEQLSAFLYGGTIKQDVQEHIGFFKGGQKAGQPKYKWVTIEHTLPRLYQPLKGTEMAKKGVFSTNEGTLRKLKGNKTVINDLLELARLDKLNGTYYRGLVELRKEMNWEEGILHGQFNQTTAATGRLSSVRPNQQNFASELQDIFISEYQD